MSDWTPVHHVHAEEPAADPDKPPADGPTVSQRDGKPAGDKPREAPGSSPVALTLNLPPEFISAMWGYGDNVLRLADFNRPPGNGCGPAFGELRLTFGAVEAVAPVAKDLDFVAVVALGVNQPAVTVLQNFGLFAHPGFLELRGDREFVSCGGFPELAEHQFACCDLPSYSRCLKFKGFWAKRGVFGGVGSQGASEVCALVGASGAVNGVFKAGFWFDFIEWGEFGDGDVEFRVVRCRSRHGMM